MNKDFFQKNNQNRQSLIQPLPELETSEKKEAMNFRVANFAEMPKTKHWAEIKSQISSKEELRQKLIIAFQLELSTIPPYLCALYSIKPGSNIQASNLIRGVVIEEMLHMILVANILNAISDEDDLKQNNGKLFDVKDIIPKYPTPLPGNIKPKECPDFKVNLRRFSQEAITDFCIIEHPSNPNLDLTKKEQFDGIGQFYQSIRWALTTLDKSTPGGIFKGDPARQVTPEHYYGSGGKIIKVTSLKEAELAIEEIVGQGEGIDGTISDPDNTMFGEDIEYAHYFKFQEINFGRFYSPNDTNFKTPAKSVPSGKPLDVSWSSVYNMQLNPSMNNYKNNPQLFDLASEFNKTYVALITNIRDAVSGDPSLLMKGINIMYDLKNKALELLNVPINDGECAGPTFEYVE